MAGLNRISTDLIPENLPYWIKAFAPDTKFGDGLGTPVTVNYALKSGGFVPNGQSYRPLTTGEITNIENSLASLTLHTGLRFALTSEASADLLIGASSATDETAYGRTWQNTATPVHVVAYDHPYSTASGLAGNSYIYVHELLHGVGLDHSTAVFGNTTPDAIPATEDDGTTLFGRWSVAWNRVPQMFDLAALQYLYGPDSSERAGNDTYAPIFEAYDPASDPDLNLPLLWDGGGFDTINLSSARGPAIAGLAPGVIYQVGTTNTGILEAGTFAINHHSYFERLIGTGFADRLSGNARNNILDGGDGADTVDGGDGIDTLNGGTGDDVLYGGSSVDDLRDVIYGSDGDDSIDGGYGNDELRGDAGNDTVAGGFGADTVIGGAGDDVLTGSAYGDEIFGSDGADFINGGFGFDRVNGGAGADKFFHLGVRDHGADWIQDYNSADGDVLQFGGAANTAASDFLIQRATTASAGAAGVQEVFVTQISTGNLLWALVDGAGQAEINIQIGAQVFDLLG